MANKMKFHADEHQIVSTVVYASGQIILLGGKLFMFQGLKANEIGDKVAFKKNIVIEATKTSAAQVIAEGGTVGYDVSAQEIVAAGAGDLDIVARSASGNGVTTVLVELPS